MTDAIPEVAADDADGRTESIDCDVLIVGGGLVGSALAVALSGLPLRTVLVELGDPGRLAQPSFDARVTALANGSARILEALGFGSILAAHAEPIGAIHVSERGHFGVARIRAEEEGVTALGYTLENRVLGRALWERIGADSTCKVLAPARMVDFQKDVAGVTANIDAGDGCKHVRARLLVAADGANSPVRHKLGIDAREDGYGQTAVTFNCATELPHRGVAFERFTVHGPIAMLPMSGGRVAVVWTVANAAADTLLQVSDAQFIHQLQAAVGYRLGRIVRVGKRHAHELRRVRSDALRVPRVVMIGNAAVSLHPVAAQGFNLALRDVAALAELIGKACRAEPGDPGAADVLDAYVAWRAADQRKVAALTHGFVRLFGLDVPGFGMARGLGLVAFDLVPGAKKTLAHHLMGLAGRLPRLARGLVLE